MQKRGVAVDMLYVVVHMEERGVMVIEERSYMTMMVVPDHIYSSIN